MEDWVNKGRAMLHNVGTGGDPLGSPDLLRQPRGTGWGPPQTSLCTTVPLRTKSFAKSFCHECVPFYQMPVFCFCWVYHNISFNIFIYINKFLSGTPCLLLNDSFHLFSGLFFFFFNIHCCVEYANILFRVFVPFPPNFPFLATEGRVPMLFITKLHF